MRSPYPLLKRLGLFCVLIQDYCKLLLKRMFEKLDEFNEFAEDDANRSWHMR